MSICFFFPAIWCVRDTLKLNGVLPYYNKTAAEKSTAVRKTSIFFILGDEIPSPVSQSEKSLILDYFDCHANPWAAKILCGFCVGIELCGCTLPFVVRFVYERSFLLLKFCQSMSLKSAPQADSFLFIWLHIIISRFAIMETKNTSWQSWLPERVLAIPIINLAR